MLLLLLLPFILHRVLLLVLLFLLMLLLLPAETDLCAACFATLTKKQQNEYENHPGKTPRLSPAPSPGAARRLLDDDDEDGLDELEELGSIRARSPAMSPGTMEGLDELDDLGSIRQETPLVQRAAARKQRAGAILLTFCSLLPRVSLTFARFLSRSGHTRRQRQP